MNKQALNINLPKKDIDLINDVVKHYGYKSGFNELAKVLRYIFLTDICAGHYIYLGVVIGQHLITESKLKTLSQWQRLN